MVLLKKLLRVFKMGEWRQYSYKELHTATKGFVKMIGLGGFGEVYSGSLNDGTLVAVKVLSAKSEQGEPEFLREIEVLSGLKHVNLVKLYGSCTEGSKRMLVYEFLQNNSLTRALLLGQPSNKYHFSWEIRSQICIGVAEGLAFLHEIVEPPIIHRDIKACNVLLDKDFTPKISDFGFARLFPNSMTHLSTSIIESRGYLAPEYELTGRVTLKADIYSFGVLLLEIVSGRCNTIDPKLLAAKKNLLKMARDLDKKGELQQLVDETLDRNSCANEACKYLKIALLCCQEHAKVRPTISDVVKMLKGEINVDKMKMAEPLLTQKSTTHASLLGSCFCCGPTKN